MSPSPSRNDPCPCGSGRKFKRCCIGAQQTERPSSDQPGKTLALARAAELMIDGRSQLTTVLDRLGRLMRRDRHLARVRFDWAKLEPAMAGAAWNGDLDERRETVLREVLTREFVEKAMAQFDAALTEQTLPQGDLEAIALAYLMCEVSLAEASPQLELNPVFKVLLYVQANERMKGRDNFRQRTREMVEALRNGAGLEDLKLSPAATAEFQELIEGDEPLRASLERVARELHQQTLARFRTDDAPQGVLTLEEYLWVYQHLVEGLGHDTAEPELRKTRAQAAVEALDRAVDDAFIDAIGARLTRIAAAEGLNLKQRAEWQLVRSLFDDRPLIFLATLVSSGKSRPSLRSAREEALFASEDETQLICEIADELEVAGATGPARIMRRLHERFFSTEPAADAGREATPHAAPGVEAAVNAAGMALRK